MSSDLPAPIFWAVLLAMTVYGWGAIPHIDHPLGSDWGHYFTAAEYIWNPSEGLAYPDFRKPWFGWILGGLGQTFGYLESGQLIGRISLILMMVAAAWLGVALADRWAGLLGAATVVLMPLSMDGALWVNHYPLLGAVVGLSFAASASAVRWPGLGWVGLAGLTAGASLAIDFRGGIAVPVAVVLVALGSQGLGLRTAGFRILLLGGLIAGPLVHDAWLQRTFQVPQLRVEQQLLVQRKGTLEQIAQGAVGGDALRQACRNESPGRFRVESAWSACGVALRKSGLERLSSMRLIPAPSFLLLGLLSLIPARWARSGRLRSSLAPAIIFMAPIASVFIGMGWVTYFDRYILPFASLLAVFAAVGISRLVRFLVGRSFWSGGVVMVLGGIVAMKVWPGLDARNLDSPETFRSSEYHAGIFAKWVKREMRPGDGLVDCAGLAVDSLLQPQKIDYVRFPPGDAECVDLVKAPRKRKGRSFLITMHRDLPTGAKISDLPFDADAVAAEGWMDISAEMPLDGYRLWVSK